MAEKREGWLFKAVVEVVLLSVGVFLALMGDQWRENAQNRELAAASLSRFRTEIEANWQAVAAVKDYHVTLARVTNGRGAGRASRAR